MNIRLPRAPGRAGWTATGIFLLFTALSVAGYATFALHPQMLPDGELARSIYAVSFRSFAQLQIVLAFLAVALTLVGVAGIRWIPTLLLVAGVSFLAEHVGTAVGFPFGGYRYTGLLGPRLGERVPALIPLSWFVMAIPAYGLAGRAFRGPDRRRMRIGVAVALLVAWDLALDPAMSFLTAYWIWESPGPYYGMPWINLLGWTVTGLAIMALMETTGAHRWTREISTEWHGIFYAGVLAMPLGMVVAAGAWDAVVVTLAGVGAPAVTILLAHSSRRAILEDAPSRSPVYPGDPAAGEPAARGRRRGGEADPPLELAEIGGEG